MPCRQRKRLARAAVFHRYGDFAGSRPGKNARRQQLFHSGCLPNHGARRIEHPHQERAAFLLAHRAEISGERVDAAAFFKIALQRIHFVGQHTIVFFEGVSNDDPIEHSQTAKEQERRRGRK